MTNKLSSYALSGQTPARVIDDTTTYTGDWWCLQVINDAVLNTSGCVAPDLTNLAGLNGLTLTAGTVLRTSWTSIKLTSGVVVVYDSELS